ncbi:MAG: exo-alpha-sialidase [Kiritimatiellae bacterium]|nr:exo-alpha-sialidase [Kiritimatiellia bacterium]
MTKKVLALGAALAAAGLYAAVSEPNVLWQKGDDGVAVYRIPALCTAPNGDLVAACDARKNHGGDLNHCQPINITIRRSTDGGRTWSRPVNSWNWPWNGDEQWAGSDPSFVVDSVAGKIFLFYNVWESKKKRGVYQFYVQESSDNGRTWSKPRDISSDIAFDGWPFGKPDNAGGFIFITSGSGIQLKDGTLLHTIVHVNDGNALFGSTDHGKTWKAIGKPAKPGDECKVVELSDGSWMINSRWHGGGRQIHVSKDRGQTWESHYDTALVDGECNAQIMRLGKVLLFSNCNMGGRRRCNLCLRASLDDGKTWNKGICIEPGGAAYSDMTVLPDGNIGILYEGAGYATINFVTVPRADIAGSLAPTAQK